MPVIDALTSPWIPASVLALLAAIGRCVSKSWLAPGVFAALFWSVFVWVSLLATDYPVFASGLWVIVLVLFALQLGAFIGESLGQGGALEPGSPKNKTIVSNILSERLLKYCGVLSLIALVGAIYFIYWSFGRFDLPVSPISFLAVGHLYSAQYADYGELEPWPVRLTIMWAYPAALLGGIAFATASERKAKLWSILSLLPSLLIGAVVAARSGILLASICWMSGCLGVKNWKSNGRASLFGLRTIVMVTGLVSAAVVLFVLVDALRHTEDGQNFEVIFDASRFLKYSLGSLGGFSAWFHGYVQQSCTFGAYTFGGVFDLLGLHHREIGLYQNFETLSGGSETNIYTAFRGLIEDFSLAGTVCIGLIAGLISSMFLGPQQPQQKDSWAPIVLGSAFYAFVLGSPISSVFTYNGLLLAWVTGMFVLRSVLRSTHPVAL